MRNYLNLSLIAVLFTVFLGSCNKNEPTGIQEFPIIAELDTESKVINILDLTPDERQEYRTQNFVINSEEEFPEEDLMSLEKIKSMKIDFNKYTLLLSYNSITGIVEGHRYTWTKDLEDGVFKLWMNFKVNNVNNTEEDESLWDREEIDDSESKKSFIVTYCCTAVLVNKIPANSKVSFWY